MQADAPAPRRSALLPVIVLVLAGGILVLVRNMQALSENLQQQAAKNAELIAAVETNTRDTNALVRSLHLEQRDLRLELKITAAVSTVIRDLGPGVFWAGLHLSPDGKHLLVTYRNKDSIYHFTSAGF